MMATTQTLNFNL